jgi:hypothetical protein
MIIKLKNIAVLWIRNGFTEDPDSNPGGKNNAELRIHAVTDPGQTLKS